MAKIYFNLNDYQRGLQRYYDLVAQSSGFETHKILKELYLFILKNYEDGIIGPKKLAYDIAGTIQFEKTNSGPFQEITELAGELELPDEHVSGNPKQKFEYLLSLIKSL